jgi:hypothetical protein
MSTRNEAKNLSANEAAYALEPVSVAGVAVEWKLGCPGLDDFETGDGELALGMVGRTGREE